MDKMSKMFGKAWNRCKWLLMSVNGYTWHAFKDYSAFI